MDQVDPMTNQVNPQRIFTWKAPLRAFKKRGKNILRFYGALAFLLSLIVFFFGDKILLIPILTLLFLFYVLTITPPPEVENIITTFGIESAGVTLRWEFLSHFFFVTKMGVQVLTLVSNAPYYYHAYFVVPNEDIKKELISILSKHIMYVEKPQRTFTDRAIDWLSNLIPDDEDAKIKIDTPSSFPRTQIQASL